MQFKYEIKREDYSDFSSGRVLLTQKTAFPVRLASEIMYRCRSYIEKKDHLTIYDPCCGGANLLTVIGFLHGESIAKIYGSDINESIIRTAKGNLSLLTSEGLQERKKQLERDYELYGKESHRDALESLGRLYKKRIHEFDVIKAFTRDITSNNVSHLPKVDIVISDLPYGSNVNWQSEESTPASKMLENIYYTLDEKDSIVAIISDKKQLIEHDWLEQINRLKHGKRKITFLRPMTS